MVTLPIFSAMNTQPAIFNFWHSGTLALRAERQSARMSEIKNSTLGMYDKSVIIWGVGR